MRQLKFKISVSVGTADEQMIQWYRILLTSFTSTVSSSLREYEMEIPGLELGRMA